MRVRVYEPVVTFSYYDLSMMALSTERHGTESSQEEWGLNSQSGNLTSIPPQFPDNLKTMLSLDERR